MKQPRISDSSKQILMVPLKSWNDSQGRQMYRLGDLALNVEFRLEPNGVIYEVASYPRSPYTGKRQCRNKTTGKYEFHFCSKKVYILSKDFEK